MSWYYRDGVPPVAVIDGSPIYVEDLMIGSGGVKKIGKGIKWGYKPSPKTIKGVEGLQRAKPKTPVQGGGGLRKRWIDKRETFMNGIVNTEH